MSNFVKSVLTIFIRILEVLVEEDKGLLARDLIPQLKELRDSENRPGVGVHCAFMDLASNLDDEGVVLSAQELRLVIDGLCLVEINRGMEREGWDLESDRDATRGLAKRLRDRRDGTARYRYRS